MSNSGDPASDSHQADGTLGQPHRVGSDTPFIVGLGILGGAYILIIVLMVACDIAFLDYFAKTAPDVTRVTYEEPYATLTTISNHSLSTGTFIRVSGADQPEFNGRFQISTASTNELTFRLETEPASRPTGNLSLSIPSPLVQALLSREIRYSIILSLFSCTISTILSVWVAVPIGYIMSRFEFRGKPLVDTLLDIPIVLPPLVVGISLLILFNFAPFSWVSEWVVFEVPAVIIAQFMVACAFAVRTMRVTFDQIPNRFEQVAMTLGCNRSRAFWMVIMPQAKLGLLAAATLAWARSLGEFGPILVFAGSTRLRTEVLPTSVYLEMQAGNLSGMLAISLIMIMASAVVLIAARLMGLKRINA